MKFGIDSLHQSERWEALFALLPSGIKPPFFSKAYYDSYSKVEQGEAQCFWAYQDEDNFLFYPFIKKGINALGYDLPKDYWDITGAYGYNGPIGIAKDPEFLSAYNERLQEYFVDNDVVAEFVRYCPITSNRDFHTYTDQISVLDNVYIDIAQGLDKVWSNSFMGRARTSVRKGESYQLKTQILLGSEVSESNLQVFFDIYNSTMQRNEADDFYFFDFQFFKRMRDKLNEMLLLSITYFEDIAVSTELILLGSELAFSFLNGTLKEYYKYNANTFQRWEILKYLDNLGFQKYSLGGGVSRSDRLYEFKLSFAKGCENPFFIGTKVHLPEAYADIVYQWQEKCPAAAAKYQGKLQGYRHT